MSLLLIIFLGVLRANAFLFQRFVLHCRVIVEDSASRAVRILSSLLHRSQQMHRFVLRLTVNSHFEVCLHKHLIVHCYERKDVMVKVFHSNDFASALVEDPKVSACSQKDGVFQQG